MILNDQLTSINHKWPLQSLHDTLIYWETDPLLSSVLVKALYISPLNHKAAARLTSTLQNLFVLVCNLACRDIGRVVPGLRGVNNPDTCRTRSNNTTLPGCADPVCLAVLFHLSHPTAQRSWSRRADFYRDSSACMLVYYCGITVAVSLGLVKNSCFWKKSLLLTSAAFIYLKYSKNCKNVL